MSDPALQYQLRELTRVVAQLTHEIKRFNDQAEASAHVQVTEHIAQLHQTESKPTE